MRNFYRYLSIILIATITYSTYALASLEDKVRAGVHEYLQNHFLNATFMFSDEQKTLLTGAKGVFSLDGEQLKPLQEMPIASGTKPMTAAIILKLQERGLLNVKDRLGKHLKKTSDIWQDGKIPEWINKITIHQLLTHTSGIPEYLLKVKIDPTKSHQEINKSIANYLADTKLESKPGTKYHYCNSNFFLLGLIIEKLTNKTLAKTYNDELFEPLGMKNTHMASLEEALSLQRDKNSEYPSRYFVALNGNSTSKPQFIPVKIDFIFVPYSDGGVISNTADLIKWHQALHQGKVLSKKSYNMMTKKYIKVHDDRAGHNAYSGYGLFITELKNGDQMYYHPGNAAAIRSESGYVPAKNFYYAILSNVMTLPKGKDKKVDLNDPESKLEILHFREAILKAIGE